MSNYFVFRITYEDNYGLVREELLKKHLLRQGWGTYDMSLSHGYEAFKRGWQKHWEPDYPDEKMLSKYDNLSIMLDIKPGDYIVIPKVSTKEEYDSRSFVIAKCKSAYRFDVLDKAKDFGHIIEVEDVFSCSYDLNYFSQTIKSKFTAYQSSLNRVRIDSFKTSVDALVQLYKSNPAEFEKESMDIISMVNHATLPSREQYLQQIVTALRNIDNHRFEDLIGELFEKNGYTFAGRNWYDKEGGDVDVYFESFNKNTLMYNVFEICDVMMPHIYIQAKKKTGKDYGDIVGVDQLIKMEDHIPEKNAILMVINLTEEFSEEAKKRAEEKGIILINGIAFASLLVRYGIEVDNVTK